MRDAWSPALHLYKAPEIKATDNINIPLPTLTEALLNVLSQSPLIFATILISPLNEIFITVCVCPSTKH